MADNDREKDRAFQHGSSGATADWAVEGKPDPKDRFEDAPASRKVKPLKPGEKADQLAGKTAEDHQEALLDEAVEETFPGSDPISPKRVS